METYKMKGVYKMKTYRQGEILIISTTELPQEKKTLSHLVLAVGEAQNHKHQITKGNAELYDHKGTLFLKVIDEAELTHEDHDVIVLPKGDYKIETQKEYVVGNEKYRKVLD